MSLNIHTKEKHPMCFELSLEGRLDMDTHEQLQSVVDMLFDSTVKGINFHLEGLEYINSMGLRVIFKTAKKAKSVGATFVLTSPQPQVKAILDIANALPAQSIFSSMEEADRYFDTIQKKTLSDLKDAESTS
jgi:anti-sigma B factor antagonist